MGKDAVKARRAARNVSARALPRPAARARSARAQGLRTLQHQSLPAAVAAALDTEVWFRGLVAAHTEADRRWATKDQVYDEAIGWYLHHGLEAPGSTAAAARQLPAEDLTFWLDSALLQQVRRAASRAGLKPARLIERALSAYVARHVPAALLAFRRRVQRQALRLHEARGRDAATSEG